MNENPIDGGVVEEEEPWVNQEALAVGDRAVELAAELKQSSNTADSQPDPLNPPNQQTSSQQPSTPQQQQQQNTQTQPEQEEEDREEYFWEEGYDAGDAARDYAESIAAPIAGVVDAAIGVPNELLLKHIGLKIPELPKFQNAHIQTFRDIASVVIPTLLIPGGAKVGVARGASLFSKSRKLKLLSDPLFSKMATIGISKANIKSVTTGGLILGGGFAIDYSVPSATEANLTGTLKANWPATWGWIPDSIATVDGDSEDVHRMKNGGEGAFLGLGAEFVKAFAQLSRGLRGIESATKWVPENEKALAFTNKMNARKKLTAEEIFEDDAAKRAQDLEDLAALKYERSVKQGTEGQLPIPGLHDNFDAEELAIRTADDGGVLGAAVNEMRIANNNGSVKGRLGSIYTESAINHGLYNPEGSLPILRKAGEQLKSAGKAGFKNADGTYYSHAQLMERADNIAAEAFEMPADQFKKYINDMRQIRQGTGGALLTEEGYGGVFNLINKYLKTYQDIDQLRAFGYSQISLGGQISDLAEGHRLMEGTAVVERVEEQILDRLSFLMEAKGQHSYLTARGTNLLNMKNRKGFNTNPNDFMSETEDGLAMIRRNVKDTMDTLRAVKAERPEMLDPLILAYEHTDGAVNSMTKLNNYVRESTGLIRKAFFDAQPELPSTLVQGVWANIYNSVLSSAVTPLKAGLSNAVLLVERPLATFVGAAIHGDTKTMRRSLYQYQAVGETFTRAWSHMNQVFSRVSKDPSKVGYVMRDDIARQNEKTLEVLNLFADRASAKGNDGPAALMGQIEALHDLERHPWLRFGPNAMTAFDGFTRSVIANVDARGMAWDSVKAGNSKLTTNNLQEMGDIAYKKMFDETGVITEHAVEHASREISMNLDGPASRALNELLKRAPAFKPFMMFPRTSMNMMTFAGSHNPAGLFFDKLNDFSKPFEQMDLETVTQLLEKRGIKYNPANVEQVYSSVRAEMKGRKAVGTLAVAATGFAFMNDRVRGDGIYDKEKQRLRRDANWKPRTYKGWDGKWYSYENLGPVADWIALTANIMDNIVDGTLDPNDGQTLLNKSGFILSSSIVNKSFMAGLEPMNDIFAGNPAALSRWGSTFTSGFIPLSGLRNDFSRLLTPQKKELDMEMLALIANRNPGLKSNLPDTHDYIDGGLVGVPDAWTRVWNTFSPWKVHDDISDEKQFLVDVEFDARPVLSTNGSGVKLTPEQRSDVQRIMGETGVYKKAIQQIMRSTDGQEFRKAFREAQAANRDLDLSKFMQLHMKLNQSLRNALQYAINTSSYRDEIRAAEFNQNRIKRASERGDLETLRRLNNY